MFERIVVGVSKAESAKEAARVEQSPWRRSSTPTCTS